MLSFDRVIDVRTVAKSMADVGRICRLVSLADSTFFITPIKHFYTGSHGRLTFDFTREADRVSSKYKEYNGSAESACYRVSCVDESDMGDNFDNYIEMTGETEEMKYCFDDL